MTFFIAFNLLAVVASLLGIGFALDVEDRGGCAQEDKL
jgi:hypothetical protein